MKLTVVIGIVALLVLGGLTTAVVNESTDCADFTDTASRQSVSSVKSVDSAPAVGDGPGFADLTAVATDVPTALSDQPGSTFAANTWTNMNPGTRSSARYRPAMAYDSQSDRIMLFGGDTGGDETWAYDWAPVPPTAPQSLTATSGIAQVTLGVGFSNGWGTLQQLVETLL